MKFARPSAMPACSPESLRAGLVALVASLVCVSAARAETVRHLFAGQASLFSLQTQSACVAFSVHPDASRCNPALQTAFAESSASADVLFKVDEESYKSIYRLLFSRVSRELLKELFEKRSFLSFSGYASLLTRTPWFSIEYVPVGLVGAYRVANPSLPEVQLAGVQYSDFRVTTALGTDLFARDADWEVSFGATGHYYRKKNVVLSANVLEVLTEKREDFLRRTRSDDFAWDVGASLSHRSPWLPTLGVSLIHLLSNAKAPDTADGLDVEEPFRAQTRAGLGWKIPSAFGTTYAGTGLRWQGAFNSFVIEDVAFALGQRIGILTASASHSPARMGFGFLFDLSLYRVGIAYADEKQRGGLEAERQQQVYLSLGAEL